MNEEQARELMEQGWDARFGGVQGVTDIEPLNPEAAMDNSDPWRSGDDPLRGQYEKGNRLKSFIADLTEKDIAEISADSRDPEVKRKGAALLKDIQEGEAAQQFIEKHPEYFSCDGNYARMVQYLEEEGLPLNLTNLEQAFEVLTNEGVLEVESGVQKELSDKERLAVARLAAQGRVADAIGQYLHYALPGLTARQVSEAIQEPEYIPLCDAAIYFVFANATPDFQDTDENRDWLLIYAAGRPLSYRLLQEGWKAMRRDALIRAESASTQTAPDLDALSSEEFDKLYRATMREGAKARR